MSRFPRSRLGPRASQVKRFQDSPELTGPVYLWGEHVAGGLLIVGDSRAEAAFDLDHFDRRGLGPSALLSGPSASLFDLLRIVDRMTPARMMLCLSPLSLCGRPDAGMGVRLEGARAPLSTAKIDAALDAYGDAWRRRLLEPVFPGLWKAGWFGRPQPGASTGIYRAKLSREALRDVLARGKQLEEHLRMLQAKGWTIQCVRLPVSTGLRKLEDNRFPGHVFRHMCVRLDIPFFDYGEFSVVTSDGSHIANGEALRVTRHLAEDHWKTFFAR